MKESYNFQGCRGSPTFCRGGGGGGGGGGGQLLPGVGGGGPIAYYL